MAPQHTGRLGPVALGEASSALRLFFGLPLPERHREALDSYVARCSGIAPAFRWTAAANLHLTIRFLGHVEPALAEGIADRVAAAKPPGFELRLGGTGSFGRGGRVGVIWLGLADGDEAISELARLLEAESVAAGLEAEGRRFHAHVTLARARHRDGAELPPLPQPPDLPAWRAGELILYRSRLGRAGSVYEPLRSISLR